MKVGLRGRRCPTCSTGRSRPPPQCDAAVVVVGTNDDWESEGHDRDDAHLPGEQDELVRHVVAANPNTVVVLNTGAPVTMNWADGPRAVLQRGSAARSWPNTLVDVLTGEAEPGGRLPTTFPLRLEHSPSFGNFPGESARSATARVC